jgi:hypothetical protein
MPSSLSRKSIGIGLGIIAVCAVIIGVLLSQIPAVQGLGTKIKLPLYHGGSTWVNLVLFTLMGVVGLVYLLRRDDEIYAWEFGLRSVATPLWVLNSALGLIAALNTWDFTASKESRLVLLRQDPRLMAQMILLLVIGVLLLADWLVLEKRWHKALADVVFVVVMWALLANVFLDPVKRAMHPDSPVLNSGWEIKGPFFGMVACIFIAMCVLVWFARAYARPGATPSRAATPPAE